MCDLCPNAQRWLLRTVRRTTISVVELQGNSDSGRERLRLPTASLTIVFNGGIRIEGTWCHNMKKDLYFHCLMLNLTCFINDILFLVVTLLICDIIFFPFLSFRISINLIQNCKIALRRKTGKFEKMFNFEIFNNELIKKQNIFFFIVPTINFFYHDCAGGSNPARGMDKCVIYVPMVPGCDESPLHILCPVCLGRYPTSYIPV